MKKEHIWPALLLVVFALSRWPKLMPANFSATYAIVFCGALCIRGIWKWLLPLFILDFVITWFFYPVHPFSLRNFAEELLPNYISYTGIMALGRFLGPRRPWWLLTCGGLAGALIFYIVTNTGAWLELPYAKTLAGWLQALTTGLPGYPPTWTFFRNTFISTGLFTGLFVAALKWADATEPAASREGEPEKTSDDPEAEAAKQQA